jgi:hypothetical protein
VRDEKTKGGLGWVYIQRLNKKDDGSQVKQSQARKEKKKRCEKKRK